MTGTGTTSTENTSGPHDGCDNRPSSAPPVPSPAGSLSASVMVASARSVMVGRTCETEVIAASLAAGRSVLLEGPPGTGKTTLLRGLAAGAGVPLILVEGNAELSPARLVGHHDPSRVLAEGYSSANFVPGPLVRAMTTGALFYIEELNRVPEETLNVLLGVLSERAMQVPRLGEVIAAPGFRLVAAMNPFDAIGTGRVTPALYDRSCRVALGYQSELDEVAIVTRCVGGPDHLVRRAVRAVRSTRDHPELRIGSSVRGAIDLVAVAGQLEDLRNCTSTGAGAGAGAGADRATGSTGRDAGLDAALAALSGRVTMREGGARTVEEVVTDIWRLSEEQPRPELGKVPGPSPSRARAVDPAQVPLRR